MTKAKFNIEEQVDMALSLIPSEPTDYTTVVSNLEAQGITEATRVITLLKQRKMVTMAVGRNEAGEKFFHINQSANNQGGQ